MTRMIRGVSALMWKKISITVNILTIPILILSIGYWRGIEQDTDFKANVSCIKLIPPTQRWTEEILFVIYIYIHTYVYIYTCIYLNWEYKKLMFGAAVNLYSCLIENFTHSIDFFLAFSLLVSVSDYIYIYLRLHM